MTSSLIFPIGHYLGAFYPSEGASLDAHIVRVGWRTFKLNAAEQLVVWALSHGLGGGAGMEPWTRTDVEDSARASGIHDASTVLDALIDRELVVEVDPGREDDAIHFAKSFRTRSLLAGLGNAPDDPLSFGLGIPGDRPTVTVPYLMYELWNWGSACDSLWHACEIFATVGRLNPDVLETFDAEPRLVLVRFLHAVQVLVAHGAVYLDEARQGQFTEPLSEALAEQ